MEIKATVNSCTDWAVNNFSFPVRTTFSRTSGIDTNQFSIFDFPIFFTVLLLSLAQLMQVVCPLLWPPYTGNQSSEADSVQHKLLQSLSGAAGALPGEAPLGPSCCTCCCLFPKFSNIPDSSSDQGEHLHKHKQVPIIPTDCQQLRD